MITQNIQNIKFWMAESGGLEPQSDSHRTDTCIKRSPNLRDSLSSHAGILTQAQSKPQWDNWQRGFISQALMVFLLVAGIGLGTYLVQQRTNLLPKAAEPGDWNWPFSCPILPSKNGTGAEKRSDARLYRSKCPYDQEVILSHCQAKTTGSNLGDPSACERVYNSDAREQWNFYCNWSNQCPADQTTGSDSTSKYCGDNNEVYSRSSSGISILEKNCNVGGLICMNDGIAGTDCYQTNSDKVCQNVYGTSSKKITVSGINYCSPPYNNATEQQAPATTIRLGISDKTCDDIQIKSCTDEPGQPKGGCVIDAAGGSWCSYEAAREGDICNNDKNNPTSGFNCGTTECRVVDGLPRCRQESCSQVDNNYCGRTADCSVGTRTIEGKEFSYTFCKSKTTGAVAPVRPGAPPITNINAPSGNNPNSIGDTSTSNPNAGCGKDVNGVDIPCYAIGSFDAATVNNTKAAAGIAAANYKTYSEVLGRISGYIGDLKTKVDAKNAAGLAEATACVNQN